MPLKPNKLPKIKSKEYYANYEENQYKLAKKMNVKLKTIKNAKDFKVFLEEIDAEGLSLYSKRKNNYCFQFHVYERPDGDKVRF